VLRLAVMALIAVSLLLAATIATPTQADAHSIPGATKIYVDGELVKNTPRDHFTYTQELSAGCHTVKVVRTTSSSSSTTRDRFCSEESSTLVVEVNDNNVSVLTTSSSTQTEG
jgi:hypothetical protein